MATIKMSIIRDVFWHFSLADSHRALFFLMLLFSLQLFKWMRKLSRYYYSNGITKSIFNSKRLNKLIFSREENGKKIARINILPNFNNFFSLLELYTIFNLIQLLLGKNIIWRKRFYEKSFNDETLFEIGWKWGGGLWGNNVSLKIFNWHLWRKFKSVWCLNKFN